jgi:large subunit ribosomal protein L10
MKSKDEKKKDVTNLHELLGKMPNVFLTGFEKLSVEQDFQLRRAVRDAGGRYRVVKNTLVENAAKDTPSAPNMSGLTGMNSLAYTDADPVALAKALTDYAKANPTFTFKAGVVEGRVIDASGIQALAALPSREDLFAKLLFLIQAPATSLVRAMNGVGRNLAVVLDQGVKEKKFSE